MAPSRRLRHLGAAVEVVVVLSRSASFLQGCNREVAEDSVRLVRADRVCRRVGVSSGKGRRGWAHSAPGA